MSTTRAWRRGAVAFSAMAALSAAGAGAQQVFSWENDLEGWEDTPWSSPDPTIGIAHSGGGDGATGMQLTTPGGFNWGVQRFVNAVGDPPRFGAITGSTKMMVDVTFQPGTAEYMCFYMAINYAGGFFHSFDQPPGPPGTPGYQICASPLNLSEPAKVSYIWDFAASMTAGGLFGTPWSGLTDFVGFHTSLNSGAAAGSDPGFAAATIVVDNMRFLRQVNTDPTWSQNADGSWTDSGNWANGVPNAVGALAVLGTAIDAPRTISANSTVTVGSIIFDAGGNGYTVAGSGALRFDVASGASRISVMHGFEIPAGSNATSDVPVAHAIAVPVSAADDLVVDVTSSSTLTISSGVAMAGGTTFTKTSFGRLAVGNLRGGALALAGGSMQITEKGAAMDPSGTTVVAALDVAGGAANPQVVLDIANNGLVVDYAAAEASPIADIRQLIIAGRDNGVGIVSSSAAGGASGIGYAEASDAGAVSFGGQAVDGSAVLVRVTFLGDTNLDGAVDVTDLGNLASGWQSGGGWFNGDTDYSGFVDVTDLGNLATNWQAGVTGPAAPDASLHRALIGVGLGAVVPEPAAVSLLAVAALVARRRRVR